MIEIERLVLGQQYVDTYYQENQLNLNGLRNTTSW